MQVCVYRGAAEIGGSCVELRHHGARLIVDLGLPLDAVGLTTAALPPVAGLEAGDSSLVGLVISHGHPDHYGLAHRAHPSVPVFAGEATERILREASFFSPMGAELNATAHLRDREPFSAGPFRITPFLVDHSAFDAYALLIEAGRRRLFYSGDLRAHGRKAALFERLVREPPPGVDALLLEDTHVGAYDAPASRAGTTEREVEEQAVSLFEATSGMVLANYSPQNVDRLVSLYRAARRSGRTLVMDLYAASIAAATGRPETIPQASWDGVEVFVPRSQRIKVKRTQTFERIDSVRGNRLFPEKLAARREELVLTFRGSMAREVESAGCLRGASAVWSMWPGYLDQASGRRFTAWLDGNAIPLHRIHSSGHASVPDLQRLADAINPRQTVAMHTRHPGRFPGLFPCGRGCEDGVWWGA